MPHVLVVMLGRMMCMCRRGMLLQKLEVSFNTSSGCRCLNLLGTRMWAEFCARVGGWYIAADNINFEILGACNAPPEMYSEDLPKGILKAPKLSKFRVVNYAHKYAVAQ